ncbi:MAG: GatB/YqeY domain-containing protein [Parcubacteria group bacterium]|nr:GatB/YqeY domain-containing protein [Parcubacteria group bacterium]
MAGLKQKISEDQKSAMKAGDALRLSVLRMLSAAISNKEIELRKKETGLSDDEVMNVISSEVKKRRDAIEGYRKGGRAEQAQKEEKEMTILKEYLPPEISDEELRAIVKKGVQDSGAEGEKDFAKVMKTIMPSLKGKASGDRISAILREELSKG